MDKRRESRLCGNPSGIVPEQGSVVRLGQAFLNGKLEKLGGGMEIQCLHETEFVEFDGYTPV